MNRRVFSLVAVVLATGTCAWAAQVGTTITYQGNLSFYNVPVSNYADFIFKLYSVSSGGTALGTVNANNIRVIRGLFNVPLNFGAAFPGEARWLDIQVRVPAGTGTWTQLTPRQELTPNPYAIGLSLPFSGTAAVDFPAFILNNTGSGGAMQATASDGIGLYATSEGSWAVYAVGGTENSSALYTENPSSGTGVWGHSDGGGVGVWGYSEGTGTRGESTGTSGVGVFGWATTTNGSQTLTASGVHGRCDSPYGSGVSAENTYSGALAQLATGTGEFDQYGGVGVIGSGRNGVVGTSNGYYGVGVSGYGNGPDEGVYGWAATSGNGVHGTSSSGAGVYGWSGTGPGVYGWNDNSSSVLSPGVYGKSWCNNGNGVSGIADTGTAAYAVYGHSSSGYAGKFVGAVDIVGHLSKTSGTFKIDHPLDPANKYLYHSFVESPDMMNIYNGNVVTDERGYATVQLPEWFQPLNRDFRYQLTIVDEADGADFVQAKVVRGVADNQFTLRTSAPGVTVSWQVTGIRQDPWANAHRVQVEEDKPDFERGYYICPELYGQPTTQSVERAKERLSERAVEQ